MKKVLISGYYGFGNTGDEAILETLINKFSKEGIKLEVLSARPEKTMKIHGIKAYNRFNLMEVIKAVKDSDILISGGGSLFQDVTSSSSLYYYLAIVVIAQMFRKKVHIFSQGIGPIKKTLNRKAFLRVVSRVETISVRDEISLDEVFKLGIKKPETILTTDPVFMLEPSSESVGREILLEAGIDESKKMAIGIAARSWHNNKNVSLQFAQIADAIIEEFDSNVILFPFHYPEDFDFADKIAGQMRNKPGIIKKEYRPSELMSAIGLMDINIGVRLHALIFSVCMGIPVIGITYDPKIDGFLKTIGLSSISEYEDIKWEEIKEEIVKIIRNKHEVVKTIIMAKDNAKIKADKNFDKLLEVIVDG